MKIHRIFDEFPIDPYFFVQEMPARAVEYTGISSMIDTPCAAFWIPSRAIHTIRCYPHPETFVLILD